MIHIHINEEKCNFNYNNDMCRIYMTFNYGLDFVMLSFPRDTLTHAVFYLSKKSIFGSRFISGICSKFLSLFSNHAKMIWQCRTLLILITNLCSTDLRPFSAVVLSFFLLGTVKNAQNGNKIHV